MVIFPLKKVSKVWEKVYKKEQHLLFPFGFIMRLMQIILDYSIFEFNDKLYQQQFGTSMGLKPAPPFANNFIARNIHLKHYEIADKYKLNGEIPMNHMKRFVYEFFLCF